MDCQNQGMPRSTTPGVLEMIHAELPHARHAVVIDKPVKAVHPRILKQVEIGVLSKKNTIKSSKYIIQIVGIVLSALWKNVIWKPM